MPCLYIQVRLAVHISISLSLLQLYFLNISSIQEFVKKHILNPQN